MAAKTRYELRLTDSTVRLLRDCAALTAYLDRLQMDAMVYRMLRSRRARLVARCRARSIDPARILAGVKHGPAPMPDLRPAPKPARDEFGSA